ncbi:hypothetical protein [Maridesulfovibrio salexigens]|uniref:Uncharacterized protein n=1 Tax=Maridesulfovibrio salexigens (strain ATCC 14822 / DSM 2638 / NCIMB 8403 / VKM B-1763) TaxID=526222 RepID=C6BYQ0_MARSD|nr:hypothetical protein [Maridesulfovibrio salexigens]ACS80657.1 hypothetical protein Desal_2602 [Maridesulfovibrio salexigens DSM 2638]
MKISRYGNRGFGGGGSKSSARSAMFRKRFSVGDILQGKLIKWYQPKLGWVIIEDLELLASIQTNAAPGDILTFHVEQLYPDIILKEINPNHLNGQGAYINPAEITREFVSSRATFQSQASSIFKKLNEEKISSTNARKEQFLELLEDDVKTAVIFFKTLGCAARLNSVLKSTKLYYMPWLVPCGLNQEIVIKTRVDNDNPDNSFYELLFSLDLPPSVPARFKVMYKKPQCGFKLLTDNMRIKALLEPKFKGKFPEFLGMERIPPHNAGGVLSELFSG